MRFKDMNREERFELVEEELSKVKQKRGYEPVRNQIVDVIRKCIILGILLDDEQLREEHIASIVGVSRVPVREAIRALEAEGLVYSTPHMGIRIIGFEDDDIDEIFRIRKMLESLICDYIIEEVSDEKLMEGKRLLEETAEVIEIAENYSLFNNDWGKLSFNQWLNEICSKRRVGSLYAQYDQYIRTFRSINSTSLARRKEALIEHTHIWEAILARDKARVHECIELHSNNSYKNLMQNIEKGRLDKNSVGV